MSNFAASWLIILLALFGANLPFVNERGLGFILIRKFSCGKPLWFRALELFIFYVLVGLVGRLIESSSGNRFSQGWEFYAITVCLFLVLSFPGFVFRYLKRGTNA
ncbi:MAG: DUF2818 family protein [Burkholderiales bacterium]|nr:DUF2818 family protein [Burkholderiales bacterium]